MSILENKQQFVKKIFNLASFIIDLFKMNSNFIFILTITCMILLISSCYSTDMLANNADLQGLSYQESNPDDESFSIVKRQASRRCVKCKMGMFNCCEPNICVKKHLRPDKCVRVKTGK